MLQIVHWVFIFQGGLNLDRIFENLTVELIHQLKLFTQEEEELYFKGKNQLKDYDLHFLYSVRNIYYWKYSFYTAFIYSF